jgi:hypothetical protein
MSTPRSWPEPERLHFVFVFLGDDHAQIEKRDLRTGPGPFFEQETGVGDDGRGPPALPLAAVGFLRHAVEGDDQGVGARNDQGPRVVGAETVQVGAGDGQDLLPAGILGHPHEIRIEERLAPAPEDDVEEVIARFVDKLLEGREGQEFLPLHLPVMDGAEFAVQVAQAGRRDVGHIGVTPDLRQREEPVQADAEEVQHPARRERRGPQRDAVEFKMEPPPEKEVEQITEEERQGDHRVPSSPPLLSGRLCRQALRSRPRIVSSRRISSS